MIFITFHCKIRLLQHTNPAVVRRHLVFDFLGGAFEGKEMGEFSACSRLCPSSRLCSKEDPSPLVPARDWNNTGMVVLAPEEWLLVAWGRGSVPKRLDNRKL